MRLPPNCTKYEEWPIHTTTSSCGGSALRSTRLDGSAADGLRFGLRSNSIEITLDAKLVSCVRIGVSMRFWNAPFT